MKRKTCFSMTTYKDQLTRFPRMSNTILSWKEERKYQMRGCTYCFSFSLLEGKHQLWENSCLGENFFYVSNIRAVFTVGHCESFMRTEWPCLWKQTDMTSSLQEKSLAVKQGACCLQPVFGAASRQGLLPSGEVGGVCWCLRRWRILLLCYVTKDCFPGLCCAVGSKAALGTQLLRSWFSTHYSSSREALPHLSSWSVNTWP